MKTTQDTDFTVGDTRVLSVLDTTHNRDMTSTWCDRHSDDMKNIDPFVEWKDAVYKMKEPFGAFMCPKCVLEVAQVIDSTPQTTLEAQMLHFFLMWDNGNAPGDWFRYDCEVEDFDGDAERLMGDTNE